MTNKAELLAQTRRNIGNLQTYRAQFSANTDQDLIANFDYYVADFSAALQVLNNCYDDTIFIDITDQFDRERRLAWNEKRQSTAACDLLVGDCEPLMRSTDINLPAHFTVGLSKTHALQWYVQVKNERKYRIFNDPREAMIFKLSMGADDAS